MSIVGAISVTVLLLSVLLVIVMLLLTFDTKEITSTFKNKIYISPETYICSIIEIIIAAY